MSYLGSLDPVWHLVEQKSSKVLDQDIEPGVGRWGCGVCSLEYLVGLKGVYYVWSAEDTLGHLLVLLCPVIKVNGKLQQSNPEKEDKWQRL